MFGAEQQVLGWGQSDQEANWACAGTDRAMSLIYYSYDIRFIVLLLYVHTRRAENLGLLRWQKAHGRDAQG
jgi:hypothetical protein